MANKPNILYVFSDQQRASAMGRYYGDVQLNTPQFDAFADQSIRFNACVSTTLV